jgi:hypothetical protein
MKTYTEKRNYERHHCAADIAFSYFNKEPSYEAKTLNLGPGGMGFKSNLYLQPGATICIRLRKVSPNRTVTDFCEGLHLVALAEVKWCHKEVGNGTISYGTGVKYFGPFF